MFFAQRHVEVAQETRVVKRIVTVVIFCVNADSFIEQFSLMRIDSLLRIDAARKKDRRKIDRHPVIRFCVVLAGKELVPTRHIKLVEKRDKIGLGIAEKSTDPLFRLMAT